MSISLTTSKVAAVLVGLAMIFSFTFATSASATTAEDLQAQISSLLAMIANLQAQLAGGTTTPATSGTCTAMNFTLSHKVGQTGGDIMMIQKFLNMDATTQVSSAGAGSPGNETAYFGPATKAAVIKFQNKYASEVLAPVGLSTGTGYWGASSRAKANAMETARCAAVVVTPPAPTGTGTTTPQTTGTGLTVSAAAQPGNSLAVLNASGFPFTKFTTSKVLFVDVITPSSELLSTVMLNCSTPIESEVVPSERPPTTKSPPIEPRPTSSRMIVEVILVVEIFGAPIV